MTKKKLLSLIIASSIFILACSEECTVTTHIGRRDTPVMVINADGSNGGMIVTDANGDVTHPCGTSIGTTQTS